MIGAQAARIVGADPAWSFTEIVRHEPGIPQYEVGHDAWLAEVEALRAQVPGLHLTGWGYRGVGVAQIAADATATATAVKRGR